jgi:hypothetical protein
VVTKAKRATAKKCSMVIGSVKPAMCWLGWERMLVFRGHIIASLTYADKLGQGMNWITEL